MPPDEQMSASDAAFLYLERPEAPMHVGGIAIVDGELDYEGYVRSIRSKLGRLPRLLERAVIPPLNLGRPIWERDEEFRLERHVFLHQTEPPGGRSEVFAAGVDIFSGLLDRRRPLWELHVLRGLEGGRSAVVPKIHQAMAEGIGGAEVLSAVFGIAPRPAPPVEASEAPEAASRKSTSDPGTRDMWTRASEGVDALYKIPLTLLEAGRTLTSERVRTTLQALAETMPDLGMPLRRLPFNKTCGRRREVVGTEFSFAEARGVRSALGGTVNDVLLGALAGAISRYCRRHGVDAEGRSMRVMVPVTVRGRRSRRSSASELSLLPVTLPLDIDDPHRRLRAIHATTRSLKSAEVAQGLLEMSRFWGVVPAPVQATFGALARLPAPPLFHMPCSTIAGPQVRLWALEHPVTSYYPLVPVGYQMGLGCAIFSYDQRLFFGLTADLDACPDVEVVLECLEEALVELRDAAGVEQITPIETKPGGAVQKGRSRLASATNGDRR